MELTLQRQQGDEWKEVTGGANMQALDLLTTVAPFLTFHSLWHAVSSYLGSIGNAFLCVAYNTR